jgi:hypothetical protein
MKSIIWPSGNTGTKRFEISYEPANSETNKLFEVEDDQITALTTYNDIYAGMTLTVTVEGFVDEGSWGRFSMTINYIEPP